MKGKINWTAIIVVALLLYFGYMWWMSSQQGTEGKVQLEKNTEESNCCGG